MPSCGDEHTCSEGIDILGNDPALLKQFLPQAGKERLVLFIARNLQTQAIERTMNNVRVRSREYGRRADWAPVLAVWFDLRESSSRTRLPVLASFS